MIRPAAVLAYFKARLELKRSDLPQLLEGPIIGGAIVMGGNLASVAAVRQQLGRHLARLESLHDLQHLQPETTYTFDLAAVAQLIYLAKNEGFVDSIALAVKCIEDVMADGHSGEVALEVLKEQAGKVKRL